MSAAVMPMRTTDCASAGTVDARQHSGHRRDAGKTQQDKRFHHSLRVETELPYFQGPCQPLRPLRSGEPSLILLRIGEPMGRECLRIAGTSFQGENGAKMPE